MSGAPRVLRGWAAIAVLVVVVDQLTKVWAVAALDDRDIDLIWTLRLNLIYNTGMSFGAGQDWGPVIGVVAMVVVVVLLLGLRRQPGRLSDTAVGLIVGGAVGNLIDRLFRQEGWLRGGVVDFVDLQWVPIFNVADAAITVGGGLLVLASYLHGRAAPAETVSEEIAS